MAKRPLFIPQKKSVGVTRIDVEFVYVSGMARSQKQKCIRSLHQTIQNKGYAQRILEISTSSESPLGVKTSAFHLTIQDPIDGPLFVESVYHSTKLFQGKRDLSLRMLGSRDAKKKANALFQEFGAIDGYRYKGVSFPQHPKELCFTWLYFLGLQGLSQEETKSLVTFDGFTDLNFRSDSKGNCQAHAMALFVSLMLNGVKECWNLSWENLKDYL